MPRKTVAEQRAECKAKGKIFGKKGTKPRCRARKVRTRDVRITKRDTLTARNRSNILNVTVNNAKKTNRSQAPRAPTDRAPAQPLPPRGQSPMYFSPSIQVSNQREQQERTASATAPPDNQQEIDQRIAGSAEMQRQMAAISRQSERIRGLEQAQARQSVHAGQGDARTRQTIPPPGFASRDPVSARRSEKAESKESEGGSERGTDSLDNEIARGARPGAYSGGGGGGGGGGLRRGSGDSGFTRGGQIVFEGNTRTPPPPPPLGIVNPKTGAFVRSDRPPPPPPNRPPPPRRNQKALTSGYINRVQELARSRGVNPQSQRRLSDIARSGNQTQDDVLFLSRLSQSLGADETGRIASQRIAQTRGTLGRPAASSIVREAVAQAGGGSQQQTPEMLQLERDTQARQGRRIRARDAARMASSLPPAQQIAIADQASANAQFAMMTPQQQMDLTAARTLRRQRDAVRQYPPPVGDAEAAIAANAPQY